MSETIKSVGGAISLELKRADLIAQNITNMNTPGYQSKLVSPVDFSRYLTTGAVSFGSPKQLVAQGSLVSSASPRDLAISGIGYFVLQHKVSGEVELSRAVRMSVTESGYLSSGENWLVLGASGPISLTTIPEVNERGEVLVNGKMLDKLQVVQLINSEDAASAKASEWADADAIVMQGMVEKSNVNINSQLIELMRISKQIESNQRVLSTLDSMIGGGISELGKR